MIAIKLNDANFEYDIYSLVKAFYPKQDITFNRQDIKDNISIFFVINYKCDIIELKLYESSSSESYIDTDRITQLTPAYTGDIAVDYDDRKETKNRLKRLIYNCLSAKTGKKLPWGTLSGIRPVKIPRDMAEEGKCDAKIRDYMRDTYLASDDKIDLSIDIAHREIELMRGVDTKTDYSIYIGIPFCPTTCAYCSFTSYPYGLWRDKVCDYLSALEKELQFVNKTLADKRLTTVYIGGGTPTSLEEPYLKKLLDLIDEYLPVSTLREYNIEAGRPDSITEDKLRIIKSHGIDRMSVNPQSMNDKTLKLIGRHHTATDVISSFNLARDVGIDNINMDIILGLPGEDIDDLRVTLDEIKKLSPDSLTVHSLAIKRSAALNIEKEAYSDYIINNSMKHMDLAKSYALDLNMYPYYLYRQKNMAGNLENIGYAKTGKEGLYNVLIMEEKQTIIALGAGADSKFVRILNGDEPKGTRSVLRCENVKDPGLYIERIDEMIDRKREKLEEIGWLKD